MYKLGVVTEKYNSLVHFLMATLRSDLIIPEVFTPYLIEETTQRDAFLQSGVVTPLEELNLSAERGGDFVKIPFYKANLSETLKFLQIHYH